MQVVSLANSNNWGPKEISILQKLSEVLISGVEFIVRQSTYTQKHIHYAYLVIRKGRK